MNLTWFHCTHDAEILCVEKKVPIQKDAQVGTTSLQIYVFLHHTHVKFSDKAQSIWEFLGNMQLNMGRNIPFPSGGNLRFSLKIRLRIWFLCHSHELWCWRCLFMINFNVVQTSKKVITPMSYRWWIKREKKSRRKIKRDEKHTQLHQLRII